MAIFESKEIKKKKKSYAYKKETYREMGEKKIQVTSIFSFFFHHSLMKISSGLQSKRIKC